MCEVITGVTKYAARQSNHLDEVDHVIDHLKERSRLRFLEVIVHSDLNDLTPAHLWGYKCSKHYIRLVVHTRILNIY